MSLLRQLRRGNQLMMSSAAAETAFDALTATADELQRRLTDGSLTSVSIVEQYLQNVRKHNGYLKAVYQISPLALKHAEESDQKRAKGCVIGPLHGIPILIKDNVGLDGTWQMDTTAGAAALFGSHPRKNASVVDRLVASGAIIMGKTTLSELGYFKGSGIPCGWSAVGGQAQSAYVKDGFDPEDSPCGHSNPAGSSAGSSIAVSAGLAPLAIGTETDGSLVQPATRASLYTIKPTHGIVPGDNIVPLTCRFDSAGPLTKSVKDLADLLTAIVDESKTNVPKGGYVASMLEGKESQLKVGTLEPKRWWSNDGMVKPNEGATQQILRDTHAGYKLIEAFAKKVDEEVDLRPLSDFDLNGANAIVTMMAVDFDVDFDHYMEGTEQSKVRTMKELVSWNAQHSDVALTKQYPTQDLLVKTLETKLTKEELESTMAHIREVGSDLDRCMKQWDVDVIVGPADSGLSAYAAAQGCPVGVVPMSYLEFNGRPIGLMIIAPRHREDHLIQFMSAWELASPARKPPQNFLKHTQ